MQVDHSYMWTTFLPCTTYTLQSTLRCTAPSEKGSLRGRASLTVMVRSRVLITSCGIQLCGLQVPYLREAHAHGTMDDVTLTGRPLPSIKLIFNPCVLEPPGQELILRVLSKLFIQHGS